MKIGILGSGDVGQALAKGFLNEGHEVWIATREPDGDKGSELKNELSGAIVTSFSDAAQAAELIVFCVNESGIQAAIEAAGADNLSGKVVIDTSNALKPEGNLLIYAGGETSLAEQIRSLLPESHVVKAFNTVGAAAMYKPDFGDVTPTMFIAGEDDGAKKQVSDIVALFGWEALDCGGLIVARSLEAMAPIWVNNSMKTQSPHHAFKML